MRPRILYTTADASPQSGAFRQLLRMSRDVTLWGCDPVLVLHEQGRKLASLKELEAPSYFLDLPRLRRGEATRFYLNYFRKNAQSIYALGTIIRKEGISLVHVNEILDLYAGFATKLVGVPCVWHIRADLPNVPVARVVIPRVIATLADEVVTVSESVAQRLFWDQGVHADISIIHDPGPDPQEFHPEVDGTCVRVEFDLAKDTFLIVLVAKLVEVKGHEILIRAAPRILTSFPNTRFLIVGGEVEGEHHQTYARRLRMLVDQLGIQDKVIFTGYRSDIPEIMAAADVVVHCSTYPDPFPGVVLQGMAAGKAVVAPNLGGAREQIEPDVSGILVPPSNPDALAEAIHSLLKDEHRRASLGIAAAHRVRSEFASERYYEQLSHVYRELIG